MARITAIVDEDGRVLAAQLGSEQARDDDDVPSARLSPLPRQRMVIIDVPDGVEQLPGSDLARFLSRVEIRWPADVHVPEIRVVSAHEPGTA